MTITRGSNIKNLALYPPTQPSVTIIKPNKHIVSYLTEKIRSPLTIEDSLDVKDQTEDDVINNFINQAESRSHIQCHMIEATFENELEEDPLKDTHDQTIPTTSISNRKTIEPEKTLNINNNLTPKQEETLIQLLRKYKEAFAWDYPDMKGIDPQLCTHHIYIEKDARPIRQTQRRLNPHLKDIDIVKDELQKNLDVNSIYPIFNRKWVFSLVVVPKNNGKWMICVDYRELNKETEKDHFPLPFIDHVLDTLSRKKFFSFLDGFGGYNQIQIAPED